MPGTNNIYSAFLQPLDQNLTVSLLPKRRIHFIIGIKVLQQAVVQQGLVTSDIAAYRQAFLFCGLNQLEAFGCGEARKMTSPTGVLKQIKVATEGQFLCDPG